MEFESLYKSNIKTIQTYETTPPFTEIKSELPLILHGHGAFQEKKKKKEVK